MLYRAGGKGWETFLFTDEKLLTVEQAHNRQIDRIWSSDPPGPLSVVEHRQKLSRDGMGRSLRLWESTTGCQDQ